MAGSQNTVDKVVGVVISDFTDGGLTALKWAHEHLKPPVKGYRYKMCIIHINLVKNQTDTSQVILDKEVFDKPLYWEDIEGQIRVENRNNQDLANQLVVKFQDLAENFQEIVSLRRFEGGHFQGTLQLAINKLRGLDMLILGCAAEDGRSPIMPQISLKRSGCSVVLARIDPGLTTVWNEEDCTQDSSNAGNTSGAPSVNANNAIQEGGEKPKQVKGKPKHRRPAGKRAV